MDFEVAYAYLLGMYLGDGHVGKMPRTWRLTVALDSRFPCIVERCVQAIDTVIHGRHISVRPFPGTNGVQVNCYWKGWPEVFPQVGVGMKHERPIVLEDWHREIIDREPEAFLRGLIHSDGCRTVNHFKTSLPSGRVAEYEYVRYFFSNLSSDIRGLFCEYCEKLGIRWTQSNHRNISVSHRHSVAKLEAFVGPKA
jgi:hypothetical protein